ncbi:MAG: hypothetical protein ACRD0K_00130 [Egibacteraceae bacterium]
MLPLRTPAGLTTPVERELCQMLTPRATSARPVPAYWRIVHSRPLYIVG